MPDVPEAMRTSIEMAIKNAHFVLLWAFVALLAISVVEVVADFIFPSPFSAISCCSRTACILLPFLTVLQTQMYMEKYPLAK